MRIFLDTFETEFKYAGEKPHVIFAGRMEGDLMAGCGQNETSRSGTTGKVGPPPALSPTPCCRSSPLSSALGPCCRSPPLSSALNPC
jgi:hypothetical protein